MWLGEHLHVAATGRGFFSCRLDDLMRVPAGSALETYGHRYEFVAQNDDVDRSDADRNDAAQASTTGAPPVEGPGDAEGQAGPTV